MGSTININKKIVVIDDLNNPIDFAVPESSKYQVNFYTTFEQFIEN